MKTTLSLGTLASLIAVTLASDVVAGHPVTVPCPPAPQPIVQQAETSSVVTRNMQTTPRYNLRRPEVVSGATATLFANFLRKECGYVYLVMNGATLPCQIIEWQDTSVTVQLPAVGLAAPVNATLQIALPDGRVAKMFHVLFVAQPEIVLHEDTIPQPLPPGTPGQSSVYLK